MNGEFFQISIIFNFALIIIIAILVLRRPPGKSKIEVRYFEHTDDIEGAIRDSKKAIIMGQVFVDGLPIGGQYVVAERTFGKFDYEKVRKFRTEIVEPVAHAGGHAIKAYYGIPDVMNSMKNFGEVIRKIRSK